MSFKISFDDFSEFITGKHFYNKANTNNKSISKDFCKGYVSQELINEDIVLVKSDLTFNTDTSLLSPSVPNAESILTLTIPLSKGYLYTYESSKNNFEYKILENTTDMIIAKDFHGTSSINKDTNIKTIQINLKRDFLLKNFSEKYKEKANHFFDTKEDILKLSSHNTNMKTLICANELFNTNNEDFGSLFTQSKILEILSYELPLLFEDKLEKNTNIKFSEYDLHALEKAREILINNYKDPPSITQLSKMVKLNEFKLKYGYKNKYKETPYKTISTCRMTKAKELLEKSELNVGEIAMLLGYKQSSNFTKAFIETFNIRPRDLIKKREYYY